MNNKFELSEMSSELLLQAYSYYNRGRFWAKDFDEWLLTEFTPIRDNDGNLIDLYREYKSKYGYDREYIRSFGYDKTFLKLYLNALNNGK